MHSRHGVVLFSELGSRIPAGIEQHQHGTNFVFGTYVEELIQAFFESLGILLPEQIMQEDPHGVHAEALRPAQFLIDPFEVERLRLPHFQLIDRGSGREIGPDEPGLLFPPIVGLGLGPLFPTEAGGV